MEMAHAEFLAAILSISPRSDTDVSSATSVELSVYFEFIGWMI